MTVVVIPTSLVDGSRHGDRGPGIHASLLHAGGAGGFCIVVSGVVGGIAGTTAKEEADCRWVRGGENLRTGWTYKLAGKRKELLQLQLPSNNHFLCSYTLRF